MEYGKLADFIINVVTALYGTDPVEINMPNRGQGAGGGGGLLSSANEEARLTQSKDKGLWPLLSWFERSMNLEIMPHLDDTGDFEFGFVGRDPKSDNERADLLTKQVKTFKTVNEIREDQGLDPRDDCDVILDGVWNQAKQASQAQAQQEQQAQDQPQDGTEQPDQQGDAQSQENTSGQPNAEPNTMNTEGKDKTSGGSKWSTWAKSGKTQEAW